MKNKNKLYLSLGLLLSATSSIYSYEEELVGNEIQNELNVLQAVETEEEKAQKEIDKELYDIFSNFFNEHDSMPFSKIISKVIIILKIKRNLLHESQQVKCDELIKIFEKNKHSSNPGVWAKILISPDLLDLMSEETRSYIRSVPNHVKIKTLIFKLRN